MKPMLARTKGPKYNSFPCYVQPKLNGIRALWQLGTFQSRDEKVWKPGILSHINLELSSRGFHNLILDGELYRHGWKLQRINAAVAVNRHEPTPDTPEVCFHVFDVVDPSRPFSDRWFEIYHGLVAAELPHVRAVPTALVNSPEEVEQHFHLYTREGYEGIMLRPDGPYEYGEHVGRGGTMTQFRSKFLWKYKQFDDDEFRCIDVTPGEGKADIGIGALVCWNKDCTQTFKVGTGLSDEDRIAFKNNPPIGKDVRIRYVCLTEDAVPFNPSFLAVLSN